MPSRDGDRALQVASRPDPRNLPPGTGDRTRDYRQLGIRAPLYVSHGVGSKHYIELVRAAANGVRPPAAALLVADRLPDSDPQKKVLVDYQTTYEKNTGQPVSTFGGHAYDRLMILLDAMKRAGSADKGKVRDAIEAARNFMVTGGVVNMSATIISASTFRPCE